jgi:tRNA threonylcarbamoyladenosine biosynthesis protein TsaB
VLVLALDASTPWTTVALARDREVLAEVSAGNRGASETLLESVNAVLSLAGAELEDIERLVVGVGPGTFTGIRIAAATARSLAFATGIPLSANSTLAALAAAAPEPDVLAVLDAKRREVFAQRFREGVAVGEIYGGRPQDLSVTGDPLVIGDGAVRYREVLERAGRIPPDRSPLHRVSATGHVHAADLAVVPAEELVPIYVRQPDAEVRRGLNPWSRG